MSISTENQAALDTALSKLTLDLGATSSSTIDVTKLTEVNLTGNGVFDKLLASTILVAQNEFDNDRIRGTDYANFYLGMVQSAMQTAASFLLAWDKAAFEKTNALAQLQVTINQADDIASTTAARDALNSLDLELKAQQVLAERIKNGNVSISHTYDDNGAVLTTTYGTGDSLSLYEAQVDLLEAQTDSQLKQALDTVSTTATRNTQSSNDTAIKAQQALAEKIKNGSVSISHTYHPTSGEILTTTYGEGTSKSIHEAQTELVGSQTKLTGAQGTLYGQKVITEMAETNTTLPEEVTLVTDASELTPLAPETVAGAKGANRDVTLEQRAGYQRKAQNDLIKVITGHVDMLVSSGAATDVGDYTSGLIALVNDPEAVNSQFGANSILTKAMKDVAELTPNQTDSVPNA